MIIPVHSNTFIKIAALIRPPLLIKAAPEGGGGTFEAAPRGGWDGQRGPPFFSSGGEAAPRAKWAAHHFALGAAHPPLVASAALGAVQIPGRY